MADIKRAYAASSNLTVTNLASLAASQTHVSGWESAVIDNSSNKYLDYLVSAKLTRAGSNNQAGEHRIWVGALLDDSTYPGGFDGTESTEATPLDDENGTFSGLKLGAVCATDTTASQVDYVAPFSVAALFGGVCPEKFFIFITSTAATSTNAALASSGNQVSVKPTYLTVA